MVDDDQGPWAPPRPASAAGHLSVEHPSAVVAASTTAGLASGANGTGARARAGAGGGEPEHGGAAASHPRRAMSGLSATRRILLAYAALIAVIALIVAVGAAVQPSYGRLAPWQGLRVDDVRASPAASRSSIDIAALISPGTPPQCLRFSTVDLGSDLVAVRADGTWALGAPQDSTCSVVPAGFGSRVAVIDTRRDAVRWVHDVADDFDGGQGVSVTWLSSVDDGSRLLVQAGTANQQIVETLSIAHGQTISTTGDIPWSQNARFTANGRVVALGSLSADGLQFVYQLRDADDLAKVVWQGVGNDDATMIALSDRLLLGSDGTVQVPLATGVASRWGGPVSTSSGYAVHDDMLYAANVTGHGVTTRATRGFTAVDRSGRLLWRSSLDLPGPYSLTRSCLAATDQAGGTVTCLDYRTGRRLWTTTIGGFSFAGSAPGQRTDDLYAVTSGSAPQLVAVDGRNGRIRFDIPVPAASTVVAASQTVVYVASPGQSGARATVRAVDASSGRTLWSRSTQVQIGVWGGHLIDVGMDGLARRLGA